MKMFISSEKTTPKRNFTWNMIGSLCNAFSSMILLSVITRCVGSESGGVFSLAFSTAQLLQTIGCYETRVIQATDVKEDINFKTYFSFRFLTSLLMMVFAFIYVIISDFTFDKSIIILLICLYKSIDALSDSFQGLFQQKLRIDISGQSLASRVFISTIVFILCIFLTENMIFSSLMMVLIETIWFFIFDVRNGKFFTEYSDRIEFSGFKFLLKTCTPLCLGSFMISYMINAPKYAIDLYLNDVIQNIYGFLVMPAFVINLFSLFVFRPLLTTLSVYWVEHDNRSAYKIIFRCSLWVLFLTVGAMLGAYLLGIFILNILSGLDLNSYRLDLVIIMFGGGFNAMIMLLYNVLAVMRKQNSIFLGYLIGFVSSILITPILVQYYEIRGAVIAYVVPMIIVVIFFVVIVFKQFWIRLKK